MPGSTSRRGYGWSHQKLRRRWAPQVAQGVVPCAKCGRLIHPGEWWDLGHSEDRTIYTGPEHRTCNRSAGAVKGNRSPLRGVTIIRSWTASRW